MATNRVNTFSLAGLFLAALVLTQGGCFDDGNEYVYGSAVGFDHTTQALTAGDIESLDGTYTNCGGSASGVWSVAVGAYAGVLTNDAEGLPTVYLNDPSCSLVLTHVVTTGVVARAADNPITLGTNYAGTASWFAAEDFYANAKIAPADFSANFVITLLYSDDPTIVANQTTVSSYDVVTGTAVGDDVAAPDYTYSSSTLAVTVDGNDVVQTVSGNFNLSAGTVAGEYYVIVDDAVTATHAAIKSAYDGGGTPIAMSTTIPASDFRLLLPTAADLTVSQVRTVIVISAVESGVASYETFQVTFTAP